MRFAWILLNLKDLTNCSNQRFRTILLFLALFLLPPVLAVDISSCTTLNTADTTYDLTQNVNTPATCINITAPGITLDCHGYMINYSQSATGYGVNADNENITIKNCVITQGGTSSNSYGIYLNRTTAMKTNITVVNNSVHTGGGSSNAIYLRRVNFNNITGNDVTNTTGTAGYGVYLDTSSNNSVTFNTINTTGSTAYGIRAVSATNNTISFNNITTKGTNAYGIVYDTSSHNLTIANNTIISVVYGVYGTSGDNGVITSNNISVSGGGNKGIWLQGPNLTTITFNWISSATNIHVSANSNNHNISYNNLTVASTGGIHLATSNYNTIISNNINNTGTGIYLETNAANNMIMSNRLNTTGGAATAIYLLSNSNNNTISFNDIVTQSYSSYGFYVTTSVNNTFSFNNITTIGQNSFGIYIGAGSDNTTINGTNISTSDGAAYGIYLFSGLNTTIMNTVISTASASKDINATHGNGTVINSTFNKNKVGFGLTGAGSLRIQWYVITNVTDASNGAGISSATVTARNVTSHVVVTAATGSNGLTPSLAITEYLGNRTHNVTSNNYTINATAANYLENSININITGSTVVNITLTLVAQQANSSSLNVPGRSVLMNLVFAIGSKGNDVMTLTDDFVSAEDGVVIAIVTAGSKIGSSFNTGYSENASLIQLKQTLKNNRFILVVASGSNRTVAEALDTSGTRKIPGKTFGSYAYTDPAQFPVFIRLQYESVNLLTRVRFTGNTKLVIRNEGATDGIPNIVLEVA